MRKFYALRLSKVGAKVTRLALYEINDKGSLEVVWPIHDAAKKDLMPCQVFYPRKENGPDQYPAYHFVIPNIGYDKLEYLKEEFNRRYDWGVEIEGIAGWAPSRHI